MQKDLLTQVTTELTEREREILRLIATGTSNKDIAQQLFISSNTVKVHLRNIFAKIGVSSRTEAAVYAIHTGLSAAPASPAAEPAARELAATPPASIKTMRKPYFLWLGALVIVLFVGVVSFVVIKYRPPVNAVINPVLPSPTFQSRWQEHAVMPTARSGLAVAVYENKIYAIGGETAQGVTGVTEQYDLATDAWITLTSKPVPVTEVNAAVIGGKIYIPGGLLASGGVTGILESYDPSRDLWEEHAPLPVALSRYALVAFEGKLYVFGGWDGQKFIASVYEYEPDADAWTSRTPMPTARGFAGAAVSGDKIYVIGGSDGKQVLAVNDVYTPHLEDLKSPWSRAGAMPIACNDIGVVSVADSLYVIGWQGSSRVFATFLPQMDRWQAFDSSPLEIGMGTRLVQLGEYLFVVGGQINDVPSAQNLAYQAIYTVQIPFIIHK